MSDHISNWISKYRTIRDGTNGTITQLGSQHIRCCCTELQHIRVNSITGRNWMDCQKWTEKCWCNLRSSPITMAQFYTMGINELKSIMWEIVWLPVNNVNRKQTWDNPPIMIMSVKVPQYNLTSANEWFEVEHLKESTNQEAMMNPHCR